MRNAIAITALFLSAAAATLVGCSQKHMGVITIDGSDTVYPLSKAMVDVFHQSNPGVKFDVRFSGTGGGFRKFCAGQVDIQGASRPIKATEGEQCA
jgi:phosphate transport system substrate-binding protein